MGSTPTSSARYLISFVFKHLARLKHANVCIMYAFSGEKLGNNDVEIHTRHPSYRSAHGQHLLCRTHIQPRRAACDLSQHTQQLSYSFSFSRIRDKALPLSHRTRLSRVSFRSFQTYTGIPADSSREKLSACSLLTSSVRDLTSTAITPSSVSTRKSGHDGLWGTHPFSVALALNLASAVDIGVCSPRIAGAVSLPG